jgi:hypothetical protein
MYDALYTSPRACIERIIALLLMGAIGFADLPPKGAIADPGGSRLLVGFCIRDGYKIGEAHRDKRMFTLCTSSKYKIIFISDG